MKTIPTSYMNSYLAGFLLGLVLLSAFVVTGRGLGASGAVKSVVISSVASVAPEYAKAHPFYDDFFNEGPAPMKNWLVYLTLGVIAGSFFSGAMSGRLGFKVERGPRISSTTRLIFATLGGLFFGLGSQFGRGCTSGTALTGMAILSTAGFLTMMAIFGAGYVFAYFFRKLWLS